MPDYHKLQLPGCVWRMVGEHLAGSSGWKGAAGWLLSRLDKLGACAGAIGDPPVLLELPDGYLDVVREAARELAIPIEDADA